MLSYSNIKTFLLHYLAFLSCCQEEDRNKNPGNLNYIDKTNKDPTTYISIIYKLYLSESLGM
ncbi:hypothetical protein GCM10009433_04780 [Psychroflexus lacisalsi]|uniref:Uncharacterized protein n=1 Tax=Psychroflexus lacisalsi TaxID=503928 RepID=A0ABN1K2L5_9FLAO